MKRKIIYCIIAIFLILGCCRKNEVNNSKDKFYNIKMEEDNSITVQGQEVDVIERSELISDSIVELYGIDDATTIVVNDEALIGVMIAYNERLTPEIKDLIQSRVKSIDGKIKDTHITDNHKIFWDISDIVTNILQGKSYDSSLKEINKIKSKID